MRSESFTLVTTGLLVTDITDTVQDFVRRAAADGLLHLFLPHATCGLAVMETGAGSEDDLEATIDRLFPRDDRYRHQHGSLGHGRDHVIPSLLSPSLTLAVEGGALVLGTWQRVVVVDPNRDNNRRTVQLRLLEG
jgi:secondary thiamine-phosphate synthase enzyme